MAVFGILLKEPNEAVRNRIRASFPSESCYEYNRMMFFVTSEKLSEEVARSIGLKGDNRIGPASGVVFKLTSAYSGYTTRDLWEWLGQHKDEL